MRKIVFDIETKNTFDDVGSSDPAALDVSLVGIYDYESDKYIAFLEDEFTKLWPYLESADVLIGFNSDHFDIPLLNKYYHGDLTRIKSIDILSDIKKNLGRRIGLGAIAEATLGYGKSGHGLEAIFWWKNGEIEKIKKYCLDDVKVTKELYEYVLENKKLKYRDGIDLKEFTIDTSDWDKPMYSGMTGSLPF
jgi:DEAD/DEAH box helicase domain-containing protein